MVRAGVGALALMSCLAFACGDDDTPPPDADLGDGDGGIGDFDANNGVSALELEWRLRPKLNDEPSGSLDLVVTGARFALEDLRAVGDAAVLERASFELDFGRADRPVLRLAPAAPGLYASFVGRIKAFEVRGHLVLDGVEREFEIMDEPPPSATFAVQLWNAEVVPGETTRVELEIEFDHVVEEIDWSSVEVEDGVLEIDRESDIIEDVRDELVEAFRLH